ncbi:RsiV family protein [Chryseobacterium koreense]|uniref:RsiV family protein n=1 Tax=Chryseobacterium koreense TaxID=232216 RepID=UPI00065B0044|nr:DUF3298 domain-containing protein [Chryseobacterium koreense]MBB5334455.1 hypothetical protein [Chryseobacterium koreense]
MKFFLLSMVFFFICSCRKNPNAPQNTETSIYESILDSSGNFIIKAKYPVSAQDTANGIKKLVDLIISQEKENREKIDLPKIENLRVSIDYEEFDDPKNGIKSYLIKKHLKAGTEPETAKVWTIVFQNQKEIDIETFLDLSGDMDLQVTKLLSQHAMRQNKKMDKNLLDQGLGLYYLAADGKTLDPKKFHGDGYLFASNLQNFVVEDSGFTFYFDSGAIAPNSEGVQKIHLTREQLKPFLRP